jgi:ABC-2 type transport system ATP-binding protein
VSVLQTRELTRTFGSIAAVDALSLELPAGGVIGLVGPNGSGKSRTAACRPRRTLLVLAARGHAAFCPYRAVDPKIVQPFSPQVHPFG